jgi:hypothetical protein
LAKAAAIFKIGGPRIDKITRPAGRATVKKSGKLAGFKTRSAEATNAGRLFERPESLEA